MNTYADFAGQKWWIFSREKYYEFPDNGLLLNIKPTNCNNLLKYVFYKRNCYFTIGNIIINVHYCDPGFIGISFKKDGKEYAPTEDEILELLKSP
jgi:hypothetical protein